MNQKTSVQPVTVIGSLKRYDALLNAINGLRKKEGKNSIGGLRLAHKLQAHFSGENNPRVAAALESIKQLPKEEQESKPGCAGAARFLNLQLLEEP